MARPAFKLNLGAITTAPTVDAEHSKPPVSKRDGQRRFASAPMKISSDRIEYLVFPVIVSGDDSDQDVKERIATAFGLRPHDVERNDDGHWSTESIRCSLEYVQQMKDLQEQSAHKLELCNEALHSCLEEVKLIKENQQNQRDTEASDTASDVSASDDVPRMGSPEECNLPRTTSVEEAMKLSDANSSLEKEITRLKEELQRSESLKVETQSALEQLRSEFEVLTHDIMDMYTNPDTEDEATPPPPRLGEMPRRFEQKA